MMNIDKFLAVVLCVAVSLPLYAGRRRAMAPPSGALSIEFVELRTGPSLVVAGSDAWMDVETVSRQPGTSGGNVVRVRRQFGIRIVRAGVALGAATVTARLESPDGRSAVRVDGQLLTNAPVVISARVPIGTVTSHGLEIEVPDSVSAGPLAVSISWEVSMQ